MERRRFIEVIAGGPLTTPLTAETQRVARVPHIGAMEGTPTRSHRETVR